LEHADIRLAANALRDALTGLRHVRIGTHQNPDGDALGSAIALSMYLDEIGIRNEVLCHHPAPRSLQFLPGANRVRQVPMEPEADLGIMVDLESTDRLMSVADAIRACPKLVVIDHHLPHERPGDVRIVDTSAAATAVILTNLLRELGATFSPEMSTLLLCGIVTDTGSFRYRNTNAEAMEASAYLLARGGDVNRISEEIFQRRPLSAARLLGFTLDHMRMTANGQIAWSSISHQEFAAANGSDEDTEGFVNELLFIDCVRIAAIFRETKPGFIRCSVRSRNDLDVAEVARQFGGGGHRNAAGCTFETTIAEAESQLIARLEQCLAS
jgi:phosphoesterase RecJ-like protein